MYLGLTAGSIGLYQVNFMVSQLSKGTGLDHVAQPPLGKQQVLKSVKLSEAQRPDQIGAIDVIVRSLATELWWQKIL